MVKFVLKDCLKQYVSLQNKSELFLQILSRDLGWTNSSKSHGVTIMS